MTPKQQATVVAQAHLWIGTPYHHAAMVRGAGVDCLMLLCAVFREAGLVPFIDPRPYPQDWMLHHSAEVYLAGLEQHADQLAEHAAIEPGDVLTFRFGRTYSHAAIVVNYPLMIHAYIRAGKVTLDSALSSDFANRAGPIFRVRPAVAFVPGAPA